MSVGLIALSGTLGSLLGAVFNYWLAFRFGRPFFKKYGRLVLINSRTLEKAEGFFERHGHISTFIGRLLPGIRQYISLPAGLAHMNIFAFCAATILGAGIWVIILIGVGYWFGRNEAVVMQNLRWVTLILTIVCLGCLVVYWRRWRTHHKKTNST